MSPCKRQGIGNDKNHDARVAGANPDEDPEEKENSKLETLGSWSFLEERERTP